MVSKVLMIIAKVKTTIIRWSHSQDAKANPNSKLIGFREHLGSQVSITASL